MSRRIRAEAFRRGRESSFCAAVARASAAATRAASAAAWVRATRPPTAPTASMGWRSSARKTGEAASGSVETTADPSAGSAFASATAAS